MKLKLITNTDKLKLITDVIKLKLKIGVTAPSTGFTYTFPYTLS